MPKYTDDEIRNMKKITCKIAGDYLGISPLAVSYGMQKEKLPIGFAFQSEPYSNWTYTIIAERLIAYKYGKINRMQVESINKNLETIIEKFTEMKTDLDFLLRGEND